MLQKMYDWCCANQFSLNLDKTKYISLSYPIQKKIGVSHNLHLHKQKAAIRCINETTQLMSCCLYFISDGI